MTQSPEKSASKLQSRPRILFSGMTDNPGGKESYIFSCFEMLKDSYDCYFLSDRSTLAYEHEIVARGGTVLPIRPRGTTPVGHYRDLRRIFKRYSFDIVWCHQTVLNTLAPLRLAKRANTPVRILHSHATHNMGTTLAGVLHPFNRRLVKFVANKRFACSASAGSWFYKDLDFVTMPLTFDTDLFSFSVAKRREVRQTLEIPEDALVLIHCARFGSEKNQGFALDVLKEMILARENVYVLFVGDGQLRLECEKKAVETNVISRCHFLGTRDDVYDLMSAADVAILPSTFEGFGYVVLEAQASGLPCVVSTGVPREVNITGSVDFVPLSHGPKVWAERIFSATQNLQCRIPRATPLVDTVYDTRVASRTLANELHRSRPSYETGYPHR